MRPERTYLLLSVLLLVHLAFFLVARLDLPEQLSDSQEYLNASRNIWTRGVLYCGQPDQPIRDVLYTRRPPFYPLLIGIALPAPSGVPVYLLQVLISLLSILLVIRIFAVETPPKKHFYPLLLIFLLATPAQFIYASRIMAEIPFQLILVSTAWSVYRFSTTRDSIYIWLFNLFLTLGMATKPVLFPLVILTIPISVFLFFRLRKKALLTALLIPLLWTGFYSFRNYLRTGSAQYSSIQTANLVNYNLRYFLMSSRGSEDAAKTVDSLYAACLPEPAGTRNSLHPAGVPEAGEKIGSHNAASSPGAAYRQMNRCLSNGAREIILDRPVRYALFHLKGSIRYFLDPGRFDIVSFFGIAEPGSTGFLRALNRDGFRGALRVLEQQGWWLIIALGLIALFKVLKLTGFLIFLCRKQENPWLRIFLLVLVGYLALVTGPLGASRFLLPIEPLLIGAAVRGWMPAISGISRIHTFKSNFR